MSSRKKVKKEREGVPSSPAEAQDQPVRNNEPSSSYSPPSSVSDSEGNVVLSSLATIRDESEADDERADDVGCDRLRYSKSKGEDGRGTCQTSDVDG